MTRKSKKQRADSDEELKAALEDPNASVRFNYDGSYTIDYIETVDRRKKKPVQDNFDKRHNVYEELVEHCRDMGLFLLDQSSFSAFAEFIENSVPKPVN